jgi:predicted nucleic acid-binding protein
MRFWDASAIVPLLVAERSTRRLQTLAADDPAMLVWWASQIECVSALSRREREGAITSRATALAHRRLAQLAAAWHEIDPSDAIREAAIRFLRVHPLRAADALQLAAAFLAAERQPASLEMITLDERMAIAAQREGFVVIPVAPEE